MRLLNRQPDGTLNLTTHITDIPPYAILSHTWGADEDEVSFTDLIEGAGHDKIGYQKIRYCARQAALDGLEYFWVDTCCIDKSNHIELSTAINSMFQWYKSAARCYVYLSDVDIDSDKPSFGESRWFYRGWTLQELVAPSSVEFFSLQWQRLGDKQSLEGELREITGISVEVLRGQHLSEVSVVERMSWLTNRKTKLPEDMAYCVLGIFDVHMPFNYGEKENAFRRLQEEIDKKWKIQTELPIQLKDYARANNLSNIGKSPSPSIMIPFSRDEDFVQRGIILDQIHQLHNQSDPWTVLVGLGGVGKSQLAIEYAYQTRDRSPETWVFWVHASNAARFEQSFRDIANYVEIPGWQDKDGNILQLVHDWLCNGARKWLIILDNVDNASFLVDFQNTGHDGQANSAIEEAPQSMISYIPHYSNGSILITSRSMTEARKLVKASAIIAVGPMASDDAVALIRKKLGVPEDDGVGELAEVLEFMPLAIVQAASYISHRAPRCSVRQYLELFRTSDRKKESLLNQEDGELRRDREAKNSIINTWQISFDHIRLTRRSAADLLSLMSFFDRQGIPEFLVRPVSDDRRQSDDESDSQDSSDGSTEDIESQFSAGEAFEDDITTLRDYSFIYLGEDATTFTMHNLVQLATRKWLKEHGYQEKWRRQFLQNLDRELPNGEYENWPTCRLLFPHVKMAAAQKLGKELLEDRASILHKGAWYAWSIGNGVEAEQMSRQSMRERKKLWGTENKATLAAMAMLGTILRFRGHWDDAEELEVQVMETSKKKLGVDHPDTLRSITNLASTYRNQGRWNLAEKLELQVMEASKTKLGADHPDTLRSMANLASTYWNQGRWKDAEELDMQVMETRKVKLGADHPDTLNSMANLAATYWNQGRWKDAEELEVQVMETSKTKLGEDHPDTLTSMANLAATYRSQGRWNLAEELEVYVMETRKAKLGADHPDTLICMANLATTYRNQSRWDDAEELDLKVLETRKAKLGADHPDMLKSMANLASTYWNQGRWEDAEELEVQVMETSKTKLGADHPDTLRSMVNLAATYRHQGRWVDAEELNMQVMETRKANFGVDHPDTLNSMANLALTYRLQSRWNDAEELEVQVMETSKTKLGADHPDTLYSMANLAATYRGQGRWDDAEELEVQVMETSKTKLGEDHPDTLSSMTNLALVWKAQGRFRQAFRLMEESIRLSEGVKGANHPDTIASNETLAKWSLEEDNSGLDSEIK